MTENLKPRNRRSNTRRCHPFYEITPPSILQLCKSLELPLFMNKAAAVSITRLAKEFIKSIQAFFPQIAPSVILLGSQQSTAGNRGLQINVTDRSVLRSCSKCGRIIVEWRRLWLSGYQRLSPRGWRSLSERGSKSRATTWARENIRSLCIGHLAAFHYKNAFPTRAVPVLRVNLRRNMILHASKLARQMAVQERNVYLN